MRDRIQRELEEFSVLLRTIPATCMAFFVASLVCMNIFANKELISLPWLSLDCGFAMSWISFLAMDMIVKRFGPKASIQLSIFAEAINLMFGGIFVVLTSLSGNWGEFYTYGELIVNQALDTTLGGTWYVVLGSTTAFVASAIINAVINHKIGIRLVHDNYRAYAIRSFVSTFIAQFADNLIFAYIVSLHFFGWTHIQCWMCALTGAVFELLCEVVFSPLGYRVSQSWSLYGVGSEYLRLRQVGGAVK